MKRLFRLFELKEQKFNRKKPKWLIELNAIKRFHLFWSKAPAVPIKVDIIINKNRIIKLKIASLGKIAKKAVTGVGDPSYTSGNQ